MSFFRFKAAWKRFYPFSSSRSTDDRPGRRPISPTSSDSTVRAGRPISPDEAVVITREISNIPPLPNSAADATHEKDGIPPTPSGAADITHEIYGISPRPIGFGGYSDIYTGIWRSSTGEMKVAIKVIRAVPMSAESKEMPRTLRREISVWKRLGHRNIHVLCGLYEGIGPVPALVSPWFENGDIKSYLQRHRDDTNVDLLKLRLLCDIMCGVKFLHGDSIVHGDIKGQNILISDAGVATLCDFGLSRILAEHSQSVTYTGVRGTSRWMAPEIIFEGERHSYASDMWACGCLFIEVWNNVPPYHTKVKDVQLSLALGAKELPGSQLDMPDTIWTFVQSCCSFDATLRPAAAQVAILLCLQLVMQKVDGWVTLCLPIDIPVRNLLQGIEASLRTSASESVTELYILADSELASDVLRHLSFTGIINPQCSQLFPPAVFQWCLSKLGVGSLLLPGGVSLPTTDFFNALVESQTPARLRPLARLLERVSPDLAKHMMTLFSTPALSTFNIHKVLSSVAWLPDSNHIVVACYAIIGVFRLDLAAATTLHRLVGHSNHVCQVSVSPNGKLLVSCSDDQSIRLWDAETGLAIGAPMIGHTDRVVSAAFSPDGRHVVSGSDDGTIRVWSTETCTTVLSPLRGHTSAVESVAYSPDGSRIVSGSWDSTVRVWDTRTGDLIMTLRGHIVSVLSVTYSPDGVHIISGSSDHTVRVWDAATGKLVYAPLQGHSNWVVSVAYSPDGTRIVSGSDDQTIRIWDAATGASIATIREHEFSVRSVAFSPDGKRFASTSDDGSLRIWDATDDWRRWDM